jgi:hypothetical protein
VRGLTRILVIAALLLLLLVGGLVVYLNRIAEVAIERGTSYALGVRTELGAARLGLLAGSAGLSDLRISNPPGFDPEPFLRLGEGSFEVDLASLRRDTVAIDRLALEEIGLRVERSRGKTNYGVILENLSRLGSGETAPPPEEAGTQKRFVVRELLLRDVSAHLSVAPPIPGLTDFDVRIPEIRLQNVGSDGGGVLLPQLTRIVVSAILEAVARQRGFLPAELARDLQARIDRVTSLSGELRGSLEGMVQERQESARKAVEGARRKAEEELEKQKEGLLDGVRDALPVPREGR